MKNRNRNLDWIIETGNFELEQENKKWNGFKKSEAIHGIYIKENQELNSWNKPGTEFNELELGRWTTYDG